MRLRRYNSNALGDRVPPSTVLTRKIDIIQPVDHELSKSLHRYGLLPHATDRRPDARFPWRSIGSWYVRRNPGFGKNDHSGRRLDPTYRRFHDCLRPAYP